MKAFFYAVLALATLSQPAFANKKREEILKKYDAIIAEINKDNSLAGVQKKTEIMKKLKNISEQDNVYFEYENQVLSYTATFGADELVCLIRQLKEAHKVDRAAMTANKIRPHVALNIAVLDRASITNNLSVYVSYDAHSKDFLAISSIEYTFGNECVLKTAEELLKEKIATVEREQKRLAEKKERERKEKEFLDLFNQAFNGGEQKLAQQKECSTQTLCSKDYADKEEVQTAQHLPEDEEKEYKDAV